MQSQYYYHFCLWIDPQEQRQVILVKRVINSVDRLCTALSDLTNQMEVLLMLLIN